MLNFGPKSCGINVSLQYYFINAFLIHQKLGSHLHLQLTVNSLLECVRKKAFLPPQAGHVLPTYLFLSLTSMQYES